MADVLTPPASRVGSWLAVVRRIIGVPDYETYVAHCKVAHPDREPITRAEFEKQRMQDRYSRPGSRCC